MRLFAHKDSGDVQPLADWRSDYNSMDVESWHGKSSDECDPEEWLEDGHLIELDTDAVLKAIPHVVLDDSYGDGVALIDNISYDSWNEIFDTFGIEPGDYEL